MFGYICPCKRELRVKEYEMYRGVYCSLCRRIGRDFGFAARMTLSYDCTFLSLLALSLKEGCGGFTKGRCGVNPLKKCTYLKEDAGALELPAAVAVLLTYFKLRDNLHDKGWGRRIAAAVLLPVAHFPMKKARKKYPELYDLVAHAMEEQAKAETDPETGIDAAAESTAHMLSCVAESLSADSVQKHVLSRLGYFVGRWVYLMDAADDRADDAKKGNFNPFLKADFSYRDDQLDGMLTWTLNEAIACFDLLTVHRFEPILRNILTLGMISTQRELLKKGNQQ